VPKSMILHSPPLARDTDQAVGDDEAAPHAAMLAAQHGNVRAPAPAAPLLYVASAIREIHQSARASAGCWLLLRRSGPRSGGTKRLAEAHAGAGSQRRAASGSRHTKQRNTTRRDGSGSGQGAVPSFKRFVTLAGMAGRQAAVAGECPCLGRGGAARGAWRRLVPGMVGRVHCLCPRVRPPGDAKLLYIMMICLVLQHSRLVVHTLAWYTLVNRVL
jgi:hypothetical protein